MKQFSTFTNQDSFRKRLRYIINDAIRLHDKVVTPINSDGIPLDKDSYHFITELLKPRDRFERSFYGIIFDCLYKSETLSANSSSFGFIFAMELLDKLLIDDQVTRTNEHDLQVQFMDLWKEYKQLLEQNTTVITKQYMYDMISHICNNDKILTDTIHEAVNLAGLEGKIFVEDGRLDNYIVEHKEGYNFDLLPFNFMLAKEKIWDRNQVRCFIVDGVIEKVSEIDQLLNEAMKTKQPFAIFAHGFSEEIAATCKTNKDKGIFDIMPIRFKSDVSSLNAINDLATVCGTIPVTHLMGQMLSCIKWDDLPVVDRIRCERHKTVIENQSTKHQVFQHMKYLLQKRQNEVYVDDVIDIIDKRLKSLASDCVVITLPNFAFSQDENVRIKIDLALRNIKTITNNGIINTSQFQNVVKNKNCNTKLEKAFYKALSASIERFDNLPTLSVAISSYLTTRMCLMIMSTSGFVQLKIS